MEPTSETKRRLNPFSLFPWRRKQQRQQQQQQLELPPVPSSILTPDRRTFEPTTSEEPEPERDHHPRSQPRRHTSFVHAPTQPTSTTHTHTYPQTYPRPRRSRTSPAADNSTELRFHPNTTSTARTQPHHIIPSRHHHHHQQHHHHHHSQQRSMTTTEQQQQQQQHHRGGGGGGGGGDRDANKAGLRTWWQQFTAAQKMRPSPQHSPHSYPHPHSQHTHSSTHTQSQSQASHVQPPAGAVFGSPLKESLKTANVQISTADANGKLYVWGYIPVVVAKWCVDPSPPFYSSLLFFLFDTECSCSGLFLKENGERGELLMT